MRKNLWLVAFLFAAPLIGQGVTVGNQVVQNFGGATITNTPPFSYVNLTDLATGAGTVDRASVWWSGGSGTCSSAFKVVFLQNDFRSLNSFTVAATRGPFDAVNGRNEVVLSPPVSLAEGYFIGVVQLQPTSCGSVRVQNYPRAANMLITTSDISTSGTLGTLSNYGTTSRLGAFAYSGEQPLVAVIPAAGALLGASAFFRTALQILNPSDTSETVRIVFHPQGQSAGPTDPSATITIPARALYTNDDFVTNALGTSGLGSLDVYSTGGALPVITARVYSDAGAAGTSGFSQEALKPGEAFTFFSPVHIPLPSNLTNFRMNIGVRTLEVGVTFNITTYNAGGSVVAARNGVVYPANYFVQTSVAAFTGLADAAVPAGGWINVAIASAVGNPRAFVYSSVIDNRTSDSTYRLARQY